MKKFLLSIFAVLFAFAGVQAEEVTGNAKKTYGDATISITEFEVAPVKLTFSKGSGSQAPAYIRDGDCRIYAKGTITATCSTGTLTRIVFTVSAQGLTRLTDLTPSTGTVTIADDHSTITWEGNASEIVMTVGEKAVYGTDGATKAGQICFTEFTATYTTSGEGSGETPEPEAPAAPTLPAACNFDGSMTVEITGIAEGATAYYSLNDENNWVEGTSVEITETTTVYAKVVKDEISSKLVSAKYTKNTPVTPPAEGEVVDVINIETIGIESYGSYTSWTGVQSNSSAVYAGHSYKNGDAIQLKSRDNISGIVTTASGGKAKSVTIEVASGTNTLNVYGKNTAYSAATDLYDNSKQGTLLGTIVCGTSTQLVIDGDYEYIGLRSNSGALYLTSISIVWETNGEGGETPEPEEPVVPEEPETPEDGIVWNLVEDVNDIKDGDEVIIAAATKEFALGALINNTYHSSNPVTVSDKTLTDTGDAIVLTYCKNDDYYTFSYDSKYLNWTSGNSLTTATAINDNTSWTIAITDGVATICNKNDGTRMLQYNSSSPRFACYLASSKQQNVRIYKKTELLSHTLTVSEAGYATLYLGFNARIPSAVEAYTVTTVNNGWVSLTQVTGVLPSNQGVIIKAPARDYKFFYEETATADVTGNLLEGSAYNENIEEEAYVLGNVDGVVGLYKAKMTDGVWLNNANKAYLPASALTPAQQTAAFYGFEWNGTTGVEKVEIRNEKSEIYDLTGRRVENPSNGIYIINGVKTLVK